MDVHRHRVHPDRIRDQVQQLTPCADRMGSPKPQCVVEVPVDALGVVAWPVQRFAVRIAGWDLTDVLGPVELALLVVVVAVRPDRDDPADNALGKPVVVVDPALRRRNIFAYIFAYIDARDLGRMVERCLRTEGLG